MAKEKMRVYFVSGYAGGEPKAFVAIGEEYNGMYVSEIDKLKAEGKYVEPKHLVIEMEYIKTLILDQIKKKGYSVSQSKRQKYPRIIING